MRTVSLLNLGLIPYAEALDLQHRLVRARKNGQVGDTVVLLEHPPVFTLGRNAHDTNVIASSEFLKQRGIEVFRVERGGDVTYHGPNQLVGYPVLDLKNYRRDVGWYVRSLEEVLIRALGDFGIAARRIEKLVGVWVHDAADAKIAQIGARIENWITFHGFALNVDPDMSHFDLIVPCGLADKAVTSMARVLRKPIDMRTVRERVAARFAQVFEVELTKVPRDELEFRLGGFAQLEKAIAQG